MIRPMHHPLWTHLPAALMVFSSAGVVAMAGPWPERVPMQWDFHGHVSTWGPPWELGLLVLLPALYVLGSVVVDELWARYEYRRAFNWFAPLDEVIVSFSASMAMGYALSLPDFERLWAVTWRVWAVLGGGGVAAAVLLERLRPWRPVAGILSTADAAAVETHIAESMRSGGTWTYWETQNPLWLRVMIPLVFLVLVASGVPACMQVPWLVPLYGVPLLALVLGYGGMRVAANARRLEVRIGVFGLRVLRVRIEDIAEASVREFSPLADFGGYGIRWWRGTWAFFFRGHRGVMIRTVRGRRFLIGSDQAERLAAVVHAAMRQVPRAA